jgi:FlaA1/EpsC-like NDP-sugar epimerase
MKNRMLTNRALAIAHDLAMIPVAWLGAYWLRYNLGHIPADQFTLALKALAVLLVIQAVAFHYYGLYRGVWRFASVPDLIRIAKSVLVGMAFSAVVIFLLTRMEGVPRSVFPLYGLLLVTLLGCSRLLVRCTKDYRGFRGEGRRVLIVGAGKAGEMLVRDLLRSRDERYEPVGFVDDSTRKRGREIQGVRRDDRFRQAIARRSYRPGVALGQFPTDATPGRFVRKDGCPVPHAAANGSRDVRSGDPEPVARSVY